MHTTLAPLSTICQTEVEAEDAVPVENLIILDGKLEGRPFQVLKDDGCNTNVLSKDFFNRIIHLLNF